MQGALCAGGPGTELAMQGALRGRSRDGTGHAGSAAREVPGRNRQPRGVKSGKAVIMGKGYVHIYCGKGSGKSSAAIGQAVKAACSGKRVFVIQFMKGKEAAGLDFLKKLEPEIKLFSFDKFQKPFSELNEDEKEEELIHFQTGYSFAKKVVATGECDVLILDEVLGLPKVGALREEDLVSLLGMSQEGMEIYLTGQTRLQSIWQYVDEVTEVVTDYKGKAEI